jgi:hypothetical protein
MRSLLVLSVLSSLSPATAAANVPTSFSLQGVLRDGSGRLQSTPVTVLVNLYDAASGGNLLAGPYQQTNVGALNGLFTVAISDPQIVANLNKSATGELWIELTIGNDTFPRQPLTPNVAALMCGVADRARSADVAETAKSFTGPLLEVKGQIRADGVQFTHGGQSLGSLVVVHNAGAAGDAVSVPFDADEVLAKAGASLIWNGNGPRLRDIDTCNQGPSANFRVENSANLAWPGQYTVTFTNCAAAACITGSWQGWELRLYDGKDALVADQSTGVVHFTLAWENGSWRVEHMNGSVGTTNFECH